MSPTQIDPDTILRLENDMEHNDGTLCKFHLGIGRAECQRLALPENLNIKGHRRNEIAMLLKGRLLNMGVPQFVQMKLPEFVEGWSFDDRSKMKTLYISELEVTGTPGNKSLDTVQLVALDEKNVVFEKEKRFKRDKEAIGGHLTGEDKQAVANQHPVQKALGIEKVRNEIEAVENRILPHHHHQRHESPTKD